MSSSLHEIIKLAIYRSGGNGLANVEFECGCDVNHLAPCNGPQLNCQIAKKRILEEDEYKYGACPGDTVYETF
jgi:hypothetical protein